MSEEIRHGETASHNPVPPSEGYLPVQDAVPPLAGNPPAGEAVPPSEKTIAEALDNKALHQKLAVLEAENRILTARHAKELNIAIGVVMATLGERLFTLSVEEISQFNDKYDMTVSALENGDIEFRVVPKSEVM